MSFYPLSLLLNQYRDGQMRSTNIDHARLIDDGYQLLAQARLGVFALSAPEIKFESII